MASLPIMFAGRILRHAEHRRRLRHGRHRGGKVIGGRFAGRGRGAITRHVCRHALMVVIKNAGKAFQINDYILDVITGALIILPLQWTWSRAARRRNLLTLIPFSVPGFGRGAEKEKYEENTLTNRANRI